MNELLQLMVLLVVGWMFVMVLFGACLLGFAVWEWLSDRNRTRPHSPTGKRGQLHERRNGD